ncbi:MAG: hypothetical protein IT349_16310 [Candidatus Eisenbacteria bacterium]|nr:hypothetical protein [Candidatus Eisenbacteria bacterium]
MISRRFGWPLAILTIASLLRVHAIGYEGLWCDEAYTALTVRQSVGAMASGLARADDAPPLFYLLEKLSTTIAGDAEPGLRLLSVLTGVGGVACLLWAALRTGASRASAGVDDPQLGSSLGWSRRAYLWAAAFLAVATTGVFHARQARSYSLVLLLGIMLLLATRECLAGSRRARGVVALAALLLCLTHHVATILVLSSLLCWPLGPKGKPPLVVWIAVHLPALLASLWFWSVGQAQISIHHQMNQWIGHYWETHPLLLAPLLSLRLFTPIGLPGSEQSVAFPALDVVSPAWVGGSLGLAAVCLAAALRRNRRDVALELGFLFLPLSGLVLASLVTTPVYVLGRTDVIAFPAFVLLIGRGLAALPSRIGAAGLAFWVIASFTTLAPGYGLGSSPRTKGVDRRLAQEMTTSGLAPEDWVVHTFMTSPTIDYYLDRSATRHHRTWFPESAARNPASNCATPPDSLEAYREQARRLRRKLETSLPPDGAAWVFALIAPSPPGLSERVRHTRTIAASEMGYPVALLVHALVGNAAVPVSFVYRQDWVAGDRVVLRIPRSSWIETAAADSQVIRVAE